MDFEIRYSTVTLQVRS
uniref:Uncharacterized protein n=1 Tax=Arundo donax TaxID=35708 RepID=A0A0A8Z3W8_ARUDO